MTVDRGDSPDLQAINTRGSRRSSGLLRALLLLAMVTLAPFARIHARNLDDDIATAEIRFYALMALVLVSGGFAALHGVLRPKTARLSAVCAVGVWAFFAYGDVADALANRGLDSTSQVFGWVLILAAGLGLAVRYGARAGFQQFLLLFAAVTFALPLSTAAIERVASGSSGAIREEFYPLEGNPIWSGRVVRRPDLYWIVADSYPGRDVLSEELRFDNRIFYRELEKRGFDIAHESYANYSTTLLSISSTLEMTALYEAGPDAAIAPVGTGPAAQRRASSNKKDVIAGNNRSVAYLHQLGYRYVHFEGLTFQATRCRGFEDVCLKAMPARFTETESVLLGTTPLRWIPLAEGDDVPSPKAAGRAFRSPSGTGIPELAAGISDLPDDLPRFVYAHIFSPHGPHTNDADCNRIPRRSMGKPADFVNQLQCVNRQLLDLIDQIIRDSPDAVIVINSDHGPRLSAVGFQSIFDYSPEQIREHLSILNAVRLPDDCRAYFAPDLTPIDTQRLVFACLGGHAPRFEADRHFISVARHARGRPKKIREVEVR